MSAGGWILSVLWTVIILALVIGGIVWVASAIGNRDNRAEASESSEASAREILDRRLASGELTIEQYKQLRETLGEWAAPSPRDTGHQRPAGAPG